MTSGLVAAEGQALAKEARPMELLLGGRMEGQFAELLIDLIIAVGMIK